MRSPCGTALCRLLPLFLVAGPLACASDRDAVEKQLSKLREQVTELQNETDLMGERLDAVEQHGPARSEGTRTAATAPETLTRPNLKVVRVEPPGQADAADAQTPDADADPGPRVVIQGEGKDLETKTLPPIAKAQPRPEAARPAKN